MSKIYTPLIKSRGFDPSPIVTQGIPEFADLKVNPRVEGTSFYEDFWKEQIDRCVNGYKTGGIHIPGRYYWYLNFCVLSTVGRGSHYADFVDVDLEFFKLVDEVKAAYKGILILKKRRAGVSQKFVDGIIDYGVHFTPTGYSGGICAGNSTYSDSLFSKFKLSNSLRPPEFQMHFLYDNKDETQAGWEEKTAVGMVVNGSMNKVMCRTMKMNPAMFKGERLDDCGFEESGEFDKLVPAFNATKKCFAISERMIGTPYIYGTGGNIKSASEGFKDMWHDADAHNLVKFTMYGPRIYFGSFIGSKDENNRVWEDCPNIKSMMKEKGLRYEQVLGCEDTLRAEEKIVANRKILANGKNKEKYYEDLQDNPLNENDAFLMFSGNSFDPLILHDQGYRIDSSSTPPYFKFLLEWEKDKDGVPYTPLRVKATPANDEALDESCVLIRQHPETNYKNLDIAGVDSYDLDETTTSKSLGGMLVLRRDHNMPDKEAMSPVCIVNTRPKRKEMFYDMSLKVAVYYNMVGNVLVDIANPLIIEYFKHHGCKRYLAPRPRAFESDKSEQMHEFGVKLTTYSKPKMIGILQTYVVDHGDKVWFKAIINDLINYDVKQKNSDWDMADALGIALMRHIDMKRPATEEGINKGPDPYELPEYREVNGEITFVRQNNSQNQVFKNWE